MSKKVIKNYQVSNGPQVKIGEKDNEKKLKKKKEDSINPKKIIEEAQNNAEIIVNDAKSEAIYIRNSTKKSAYSEGYAEGLSKGYEDTKKEHENVLIEAELEKQKMINEYLQYLSGAENEIVNIILEISKKVIHDKVMNSKEDILLMVRQSIEKCCNSKNITVRLATEDYNYVKDNKDRLIATTRGLEELNVINEETFEQGSCIVESEYGSVDAGVNTKFDNIEKEFSNILNSQAL